MNDGNDLSDLQTLQVDHFDSQVGAVLVVQFGAKVEQLTIIE